MWKKIGNIKEVEGGVKWEIGDFLSLGGDYETPSFSFASASWVPGINVWHTENGNGRHIRLWLLRTSSGLPPIHLEFSFSVRTRDGRKHGEQKRTKVFDTTGVYFYSDWIRLDSHRNFVPNGTLTVLCTLRDMKGDEDAGENRRSEFNVPPCGDSLSRDYKELFLSEENCDVIFRVQDREFKAHRIILRARSPVLASTFRSDMEEKATGVVDIQDLEPSDFSDFLCFLYCAELDKLSDENVFGLFTAADKYDVQDLRAKCVEYMKQNLSVDTFCDVIRLALLHSETEMIQLSNDFFIKNALEITKTVEWQTFNAENPIQGNELFIKFLSSVKRSDE